MKYFLIFVLSDVKYLAALFAALAALVALSLRVWRSCRRAGFRISIAVLLSLILIGGFYYLYAGFAVYKFFHPQYEIVPDQGVLIHETN